MSFLSTSTSANGQNTREVEPYEDPDYLLSPLLGLLAKPDTVHSPDDSESSSDSDSEPDSDSEVNPSSLIFLILSSFISHLSLLLPRLPSPAKGIGSEVGNATYSAASTGTGTDTNDNTVEDEVPDSVTPVNSPCVPSAHKLTHPDCLTQNQPSHCPPLPLSVQSGGVPVGDDSQYHSSITESGGSVSADGLNRSLHRKKSSFNLRDEFTKQASISGCLN